jgi:hypothetical protein
VIEQQIPFGNDRQKSKNKDRSLAGNGEASLYFLSSALMVQDWLRSHLTDRLLMARCLGLL